MGDTLIEAGEPPGVEMFGALELRLNSSNSSGYCDVYPLKGRKKNPWQAKIYRPWRKDFINLGTFASAHAAAVAVAQQRLEGIEDCPSPDKKRAENSMLRPRPASYLPCLLSLICCCSYLVRKEKQKILAAAPIDTRRLLHFKASRTGLRSCQSRRRSRGPWPRALVLLQQATLALRCLRPRLHLSRRQCRERWAVFRTEGNLQVAKTHLGHVRGTQTRHRRSRGSIEATIM